MSDEKPKLTNKQRVFIDEYVKCFNASEAARRAGYNSKANVIGSQLLANPNIKAEIQERLNEVHMGADEALKLLSDIAHADIGVFWKVADEWMFNPLPEYEILDEKEVLDESTIPPTKRISYRVRHIVLDMDKVIDPRYSHMVHEFTNSRKSGLSIKTYNKHDAVRDVLKVHGRFAPDKLDLTTGGETLNRIEIVYADSTPKIAQRTDTDKAGTEEA